SDLDDVIIYASDCLASLLGIDKKTLEGMKLSSILFDAKSSIEDIRPNIARNKNGHASTYKVRLQKSDSLGLLVLVNSAPLYDEKRKIIGVFSAIQDLSGKKKVEESLEDINKELAHKNEELFKSQEHLSAINEFSQLISDKDELIELTSAITKNVVSRFDFEDCVIYILDQERQVLYQSSAFGPKDDKGAILNPITLKVGQGIVGEVAKTGKSKIIHDTSKESKYVVDDRVRQSEITVPILFEGKVLGIIDSEHSQKHFFTQAHLDTLTTIAHLAASKIRSTIAWQKHLEVEKELIESESKIRNIIDSSLDAVILIDAESKVTEWNQQAVSLFGFSQTEAIGVPLSTLIIPKQYRDAHAQGMKHYHNTGEGPVLNKRIEITAIDKRGKEFPIELSIIPMDIRGEKFFSAFLRDISQEKANKEKLEAALSKEKELNELKSKFVSMTSHEFRTPLTTIKSNIDLLSYKVENGKDLSSIDKNIHRIDKEVERLTHLMNDILTIGRIESGRMPFDRVPSQLHELAESIVNESFFPEGSDHREVKLEVSGKARDILMDGNVFAHVINNLISNALKYSVDRPAPKVKVDYQKERVSLIVKDYGIGIPKKDINRLTDSFYRANNVGNIQGSGLGLTIVQQFVQMHDGHLEIESKEGEGTTVKVHIHYINYLHKNY
ncbi:MAG: PAS domain S-box protein, partial [Bacteroidota bacterium]